MGRHKEKRGAADEPEPRISVKLHVGGDAIGPGKVELLRHIAQEGGISPAARKMGLSFRRAWHLVETINKALGAPAVETEVGGAGGGGARLTPLGEGLVARYDALIGEIGPAAQRLLDWMQRSHEKR